MEKILLLAGIARSGKDTVATMLTKKLNGKCFTIAWADYLKFIATKYFGWDGKKDEKGRHLLQFLGTDVIRAKDVDFHVNIVHSVINVFSDEFDYFIITDTRFPSEIATTKNRFGKNVLTVKIERLGFTNNLTEEQKKHPSETALDDFAFDYYVKSESGLDKLEVEVDKLVSYLEGECVTGWLNY